MLLGKPFCLQGMRHCIALRFSASLHKKSEGGSPVLAKPKPCQSAANASQSQNAVT